MLRESPHVAQIGGDYFRRRYVDEKLELLVWYESDQATIHGFQLSYDPEGVPRVVTWTPAKGLTHARLDLGEDDPLANRSPVLVPGGDYKPSQVLESFRSSAVGLSQREKAFVENKLANSEHKK